MRLGEVRLRWIARCAAAVVVAMLFITPVVDAAKKDKNARIYRADLKQVREALVSVLEEYEWYVAKDDVDDSGKVRIEATRDHYTFWSCTYNGSFTISDEGTPGVKLKLSIVTPNCNNQGIVGLRKGILKRMDKALNTVGSIPEF